MHIRLKNLIKKLDLDSKELEQLQKLYDSKIKEELDNDVKILDDKIKAYKEKLKNKYQKEKDTIREKRRVNQIKI